MSLSSLYGPGVLRRLRPWRDGERRRRSCGELSRRRPPETAWTGDSATAAMGLFLLLAYSLSAYNLGTIFEVLRNDVVDHVGGEAEQEGGHEVP